MVMPLRLLRVNFAASWFVASWLAACGGLQASEIARLPAFPALPKLSQAAPEQIPEQILVQIPNQSIAIAQLFPANPFAFDAPAPEANIVARAGPVKSAVLPAMLGLGYQISEDNAFWTVLTKPAGGGLTSRMTVTFGSIGPQTRVIADLKHTTGGALEAVPAPDHPDRSLIQARLDQVKAQLEGRNSAPSIPGNQAQPAPQSIFPAAATNQPQSIPAAPIVSNSAPSEAPVGQNSQSSWFPALPPLFGGPQVQASAPVQSPYPQSPASAISPPPAPAPAQPSWIPNLPPLFGGQEPPSLATAPPGLPPIQQPPSVQAQKSNPLTDWIPPVPALPSLPNLIPAPPTEQPADNRPLRKGQTRVRL